MTTTSEEQAPPPSAFKRYSRKVYNPLGFKKAYNFVFFFIFAGALLGFCLYNVRVVDVNGYWIKDAPPGDEYYFRLPRYNLVSWHIRSLPLSDSIVAASCAPGSV